MNVRLDRGTVAPGGEITITVTVHNGRSTTVSFLPDSCGDPFTTVIRVSAPPGPTGRTWSGLAGTFKVYALADGRGVGGVPLGDPLDVPLRSGACRPRAGAATLAPGEALTEHLMWRADQVPGVPAREGIATLTVRFSHDPSPSPSHPHATGALPMVIEPGIPLTLSQEIAIAGAGDSAIGAGQALDALLSDQRFVTWLELQPRSTWTNVNVALIDNETATRVGPAGPSWEIDLFREHGVPRNYSIAYVDPISGQLTGLDICDAACGEQREHAP